jgi:hypothetical protein
MHRSPESTIWIFVICGYKVARMPASASSEWAQQYADVSERSSRIEQPRIFHRGLRTPLDLQPLASRQPVSAFGT